MECNVHPGTEAVTTCVLCGSPICPLCASESNQVHLCIPHYRERVEEIAAQLSPDAARLAEERRKTEAKAGQARQGEETQTGQEGQGEEEIVIPPPPQAQAVFASDTGTSLWEREAGEEAAAGPIDPGAPMAPPPGPARVPAALSAHRDPARRRFRGPSGR